MIEILQEVTDWGKYKVNNGVYHINGAGKLIAYQRNKDSEVQVLNVPSNQFSKSRRKFVKIGERAEELASHIVKVEGSKLYAYHGGHYSSVNHARTTVQNLGCNVIYGHTHDCQRSVMQHISGIHIAQSMGCLCKMKKDFLKGRKVNWTHNVGIVDFFSDGWFNLITLDIHNGTTTWNNEIIEGD